MSQSAGMGVVVRQWGVLVLLVLLSLPAVFSNLIQWPLTDEANYLLEARKIAQGLLPYRDFFEFVTPLGQALGGAFFYLNGFSVIGIRLLIGFGWLLQLILIWEMGKAHLSKSWLVVLLGFLWLTDSRYIVYQHHFWSGLFALIATFCAWRYLQEVYAGEPAPKQQRWLWALALFNGFALWSTQSLGVALTAGVGVFSWLHVYLHEREERDIPYSQVKSSVVLKRWVTSWGLHWLLPFLGLNVFGLGILAALGILDDFWRDAVLWLGAGHYQKTTLIGYFSTFQAEFKETVKPLTEGLPLQLGWLFLSRLPVAAHLFLMGLLPVLGIIGMGYKLPSRFVYRLLQKPDEELLLFWVMATVCIVSTFSYSTSMHIASNGALAYLLGFIMLSIWSQGWKLRYPFSASTSGFLLAFLLLLSLGYGFSGGLQLAFGSRITGLKGIPEPLLYLNADTSPAQYLKVISYLDEAKSQGKPVFVFSQSPGLYLANTYQQATRFTLIIPVYTGKAQLDEILQQLETHKPLYIVDDQTTRFIHQDARFAGYSPVKLTLPGLASYLQSHYRLQSQQGRFLVYKRASYFD